MTSWREPICTTSQREQGRMRDDIIAENTKNMFFDDIIEGMV